MSNPIEGGQSGSHFHERRPGTPTRSLPPKRYFLPGEQREKDEYRRAREADPSWRGKRYRLPGEQTVFTAPTVSPEPSSSPPGTDRALGADVPPFEDAPQEDVDRLWGIIDREPAIAESVRRGMERDAGIIEAADPRYRDRLRALHDRLAVDHLRFTAELVERLHRDRPDSVSS